MAKAKKVFETTFSTYEEAKFLDAGGNGTVYKVENSAGEIFALKYLDPQKSNSEKRKRFQNEINFCSRFEHPNIVKVLDHGLFKDEKGGSSPFYVMPLFEGSLRDLMKTGIEKGKVLRYFSHVLDGVEAAHLKSVFHRDLKPENILYDKQADRLVVADFGIAHFVEEYLLTVVQTALNDRMANFQYAAPEQRVKGSVVDYRADIYALGLILNEMFTGQIPLGTDFKKVNAVSPEYEFVDGLVDWMLRQVVTNRIDSIDKVKLELIARKQDYLERQRLSELLKTVIFETDIDDPLVVNPIKVVNYDYKDGNKELTLILSQPINSRWEEAFYRSNGYRATAFRSPRDFRFEKNKAKVQLFFESEAEDAYENFVKWLPFANDQYKNELKHENQQRIEQQRIKQREQIEEAERELQVKQKIQTRIKKLNG